MKSKLLLKFCLLMVLVSNAQNYQVTYKRTANIDYQLRNEYRKDVRKRVAKYLAKDSAKFQLNTNLNKSLYSRITDNPNDTYNSKAYGSNVSIYKDFKKMLLLKNTFFNDELLLIKDSIPVFNWEETGNTKKVLGYNCKQIKSSFQNNEIIAWYSNELPISNGPDIYWYSKGLILELNTGNHVFTAVDKKKSTSSNSIKTLTQGRKIDLKEYSKLIDELKSSFTQNKK